MFKLGAKNTRAIVEIKATMLRHNKPINTSVKLAVSAVKNCKLVSIRLLYML